MTENTEMELKDKAAFDLFLTFHTSATHWTADFYRLVAKSDFVNRELLRRVYRLEVTVWEEWHGSESEKDFFASHHIERFFVNDDDRSRYKRFSGR